MRVNLCAVLFVNFNNNNDRFEFSFAKNHSKDGLLNKSNSNYESSSKEAKFKSFYKKFNVSSIK